jgi:hypothetical protein
MVHVQDDQAVCWRLLLFPGYGLGQITHICQESTSGCPYHQLVQLSLILCLYANQEQQTQVI